MLQIPDEHQALYLIGMMFFVIFNLMFVFLLVLFVGYLIKWVFSDRKEPLFNKKTLTDFKYYTIGSFIILFSIFSVIFGMIIIVEYMFVFLGSS